MFTKNSKRGFKDIFSYKRDKIDVTNLCTKENSIQQIETFYFNFPTIPKPDVEGLTEENRESTKENQDIKIKIYDPFKKKPKNTPFKKGKWSEEEDVSLVQGIEKFGRRWLKISAEAVKTRSPAACIKRAQAMTKTLQ